LVCNKACSSSIGKSLFGSRCHYDSLKIKRNKKFESAFIFFGQLRDWGWYAIETDNVHSPGTSRIPALHSITALVVGS
jgi:hypothetical protein